MCEDSSYEQLLSRTHEEFMYHSSHITTYFREKNQNVWIGISPKNPHTWKDVCEWS